MVCDIQCARHVRGEPGRSIHFTAGGQGGNLHQVDIEEGFCVVGFSGHENGVLVRLGFYLL